MSVIDLFSKRQKRLRNEAPDIYQYAEIPMPLRVQIMGILRDILGEKMEYDQNSCRKYFGHINDCLCNEYGLLHLSEEIHESADVQVIDFLLNAAATE